MSSSYIILFSLLVCICKFPLFESNSKNVSSSSFQRWQGPVDIVVKDTKFVNTKTPLTILPRFSELHNVKNTGKSVEVAPATHSDGMLWGGVLGHEVYKFCLTRFYWNKNATGNGIYSYSTIDGKEGTLLETLVMYYNIKYGSFEKAKGHPDGLAQLAVRVNVLKSPPNFLFCPFESMLKWIRKPGQQFSIINIFTYDWMANFPQDSIYYSYPGSYLEEKTGKTYPATTCVFPLVLANYISQNQFSDSFASLENDLGKPLFNVAPQYPSEGVPIKRAKNIRIIALN